VLLLSGGEGYSLTVRPELDDEGWLQDSDYDVSSLDDAAAMVPLNLALGDKGDFIAVGGDGVEDGTQALNGLWRWRAFDFLWEKLPQTLVDARVAHVAIGLPDTALKCED